ncbi:MAG: energy-coupling factor transporter ATPase [Lachnospira sp.]|nr:energy-coupling factor transporter ATPase [Lachnospira sp.]
MIEIKNLTYTYEQGTGYEAHALNGVSTRIPDGQFIGLIGHTGSGKSTLIQHLNGLMKATTGDILVDGTSIYSEHYDMRKLRSTVGLVFQYPEHQLFETTVLKDVMFGPKNLGLSDDAAKERARKALELTGLSGERFENASPFDLSGGQKRRAAIAGVLAMEPKVLILDEPTAGLDPRGRDEILSLIRDLHERRKMTVILVSHSMEDVAQYVERIIVIDSGKIRFDGTPREVFRHYRELEALGLAAPQVTYLMHDLADAGFTVDTDAITVDESRDSILKSLPQFRRTV